MKTKKKALIVVKALVSFSLLYWIAYSVDWREVFHVWGGASKVYLALMPMPLFLHLYFFAIRWGVLLRGYGMDLSLSRRYLFYIVGYFFNTFFPGNLGGDVVRIGCAAAVLKRRYLTLASLALIERFLGLCAVLILGCAGYFAGYRELADLIAEEFRFMLFVFAFLLVVGMLCFRPLATMTGRMLSNFKWSSKIGLFFTETGMIKAHSLFYMLVLSLLAQLAGICSSILALKALDMDVPFSGFLVIFAIVSVVTLVPVSFGGVGVREGLSVVLLAKFGISPEMAVSFSLLFYIRQLFVSIVGGGVYVVLKKSDQFSIKKKDGSDGKVTCEI